MQVTHRGPFWLQTSGSGQVGSVVGALWSRGEPYPCAGTREGPAQGVWKEVRNGKAAISSGTGETLGSCQSESGCQDALRVTYQACSTFGGNPPHGFACLGPLRLGSEKVTSDSQLISVGKMF